jgi:hypothetical protein
MGQNSIAALHGYGYRSLTKDVLAGVECCYCVLLVRKIRAGGGIHIITVD